MYNFFINEMEILIKNKSNKTYMNKKHPFLIK